MAKIFSIFSSYVSYPFRIWINMTLHSCLPFFVQINFCSFTILLCLFFCFHFTHNEVGYFLIPPASLPSLCHKSVKFFKPSLFTCCCCCYISCHDSLELMKATLFLQLLWSWQSSTGLLNVNHSGNPVYK